MKSCTQHLHARQGEELHVKGENWENWINSCIPAWRKANSHGERDSPFHTVCCSDNPVVGDDGSPADVGALHVQTDLPGPLPQHSPAATHDPVHHAHALAGQATLWKGQSHTEVDHRVSWEMDAAPQVSLAEGCTHYASWVAMQSVIKGILL